MQSFLNYSLCILLSLFFAILIKKLFRGAIVNIEPNPASSPRTGWPFGALVGGLLMLPLIALSFVGEQWLNLPFIPFDLFDWLARVLSGDVIRFGINLMVNLIQALNLGETSSTAKTLEQIQAILFVIAIGGVVGAGVFFSLRNMPTNKAPLFSGVIGGVLGLAFVLIHASLRSDFAFVQQADSLPSMGFILLVFIGWGVAVGVIYTILNPPEAVQTLSLNRRQFLVQVGGTAATITVMGIGAGTLLNLNRRDADTMRVSPSALEPSILPPRVGDSRAPASGTRPEYTPLDNYYRIDISARPPVIDGDSYRLNVNGLVHNPLSISLEELTTRYEPVDQLITLSCISNRIAGDLISTTRWTGIPFYRLLEDWNLQDNAAYLRIISADGFDEWVSIDLIRQDPRVMLCYAWDGQPLRERHGFPLRIYIPDLYGMKQPKWITEIQVTDTWGAGYWVARQWDAEAYVNPVSVIDTVAANDAYQQDGVFYIPVGGIAYSGAKGISRVEVRVDGGEWQPAQVHEPLSELTWVLWRFDWPFEAGQHTFDVQCYTADGTLQPTDFQGVFPSGATGIHSITTRLPSKLS
jgi:DMSO/TMAO reductase YedYZ molybdopterin-dependent catalytic subunit